MAKSYLVCRLHILDKDRYQSTRFVFQRLAEAFGAKLIARSESAVTLEGQPPGGVLIVFEYPDLPSLQRCLRSPEYEEARGLLRDAITADVWIVDGT